MDEQIILDNKRLNINKIEENWITKGFFTDYNYYLHINLYIFLL